jgi:N-hydroxyarylamine O-acetyltransferase
VDLDRYCARVGYAGPREPSLDVLRALHLRHAEAIPFENLNPLLGLPVPLDAGALERKMLHQGRGGWCFEQNWLFRRALEAIGFDVRGLAARVLWGAPEGRVGARSHMVLEVAVERRVWLADVGFGGVTLTGPLDFWSHEPQPTPHETFRINHSTGGDYLLAVELELWTPMYQFRREEQLLPDYEVASFYLCHHPDSFFRHDLVAARAFPGGRFALRNNTLSIHRLGQPVERRLLASPAELRDALERQLLLRPPQHPGLAAVLERAAAGPPSLVPGS